MLENHLKTIPPPSSLWKNISLEAGPWHQKGWGLLPEMFTLLPSSKSRRKRKVCKPTSCQMIFLYCPFRIRTWHMRLRCLRHELNILGSSISPHNRIQGRKDDQSVSRTETKRESVSQGHFEAEHGGHHWPFHYVFQPFLWMTWVWQMNELDSRAWALSCCSGKNASSADSFRSCSLRCCDHSGATGG